MNTNASHILDRNGRQIWPSLGADFTSGAKSASGAAGAATSLVNTISGGAKGKQTDAGKVSQSVGQLAGQVAGIALAVPAIGPVVAVVAGVVAAAAALVDALFGSSEDDAYMEQAGQYNQLNVQLRQRITQVDAQTRSVGDALNIMDKSLKEVGLSGIPTLMGMGSFAQDQLNAAVASNNELQQVLDRKVAELQSLITQFNKAVTDTYNAITGKNTATKVILWSLGIIAGAGATYLIVKKLKNQL